MLEDLFLNDWGIWLCFAGEPNEPQQKYYENYLLAYQVKSPADLAYLWNKTNVRSLNHYLLTHENTQNIYQYQDKWRKVNSIQFFKKGIQPKWEDPKNQHGGRFVFSIARTQLNREEIYQSLVFFILGQNYQHDHKINGLRFISSKNNQVAYRVEIWVNFNQECLESLRYFQNLLTELFRELQYDSQSVRFFENKSK